MNVLVIGGTGFIGPWVTRHLVERGHRVAIVHRGSRATDLPPDIHDIHGIHDIRGDRDALVDLRPQLLRFAPAVVLDVICYTERQARALTETLRGVAERLVVLSSADVYRNYDGLRRKTTVRPDPVPLSEEAPLRETLYPYRGQGLPFQWADDYEKILVERIVLGDSSLPGTILRLPAVYGPGDRQHRIGTYLDRMSAEQPVLMRRDQAAWRWTRGYVEEVASAIALATVDDRAKGRVYNVGEESALGEREWVEEIGTVIDWKGRVSEVGAEELPENERQPFDFRYELATDTGRIRHELGYRETIDRNEALRRTIEWELAWQHRSPPQG